MTSAGILRTGSKALVVRRERAVLAMLMGAGEVAAATDGRQADRQPKRSCIWSSGKNRPGQSVVCGWISLCDVNSHGLGMAVFIK